MNVRARWVLQYVFVDGVYYGFCFYNSIRSDHVWLSTTSSNSNYNYWEDDERRVSGGSTASGKLHFHLGHLGHFDTHTHSDQSDQKCQLIVVPQLGHVANPSEFISILCKCSQVIYRCMIVGSHYLAFWSHFQAIFRRKCGYCTATIRVFVNDISVLVK
jgi:hypothetical protein